MPRDESKDRRYACLRQPWQWYLKQLDYGQYDHTHVIGLPQGDCKMHGTKLMISSRDRDLAGGGTGFCPPLLGNLVHIFDFLYQHTDVKCSQKHDSCRISNAFLAIRDSNAVKAYKFTFRPPLPHKHKHTSRRTPRSLRDGITLWEEVHWLKLSRKYSCDILMVAIHDSTMLRIPLPQFINSERIFWISPYPRGKEPIPFPCIPWHWSPW